MSAIKLYFAGSPEKEIRDLPKDTLTDILRALKEEQTSSVGQPLQTGDFQEVPKVAPWLGQSRECLS
jgi:hypothetical protein